MDRETLTRLIRQGPVRVRMNNRDVYDIPKLECAVVDDLHAYILSRDDDNVLRARILALLCMCSAQPYELEDA